MVDVQRLVVGRTLLAAEIRAIENLEPASRSARIRSSAASAASAYLRAVRGHRRMK